MGFTKGQDSNKNQHKLVVTYITLFYACKFIDITQFEWLNRNLYDIVLNPG